MPLRPLAASFCSSSRVLSGRRAPPSSGVGGDEPAASPRYYWQRALAVAEQEQRRAKEAADNVAAANAAMAKAEQERRDAEARRKRWTAEAAAWKDKAERTAVTAAAIKKLAGIVRSETDPLVTAVMDSWLQIDALRKRNPSQEDAAQELNQVMRRLVDVALWMPITREARLEWISNPASLPFIPSPATAESILPSRLLSAIKRLQSVDSSQGHPPAVALLECMERVRDALLQLHDAAPNSDLTFVAINNKLVVLERVALSLHVQRDLRWIAPNSQQDDTASFVFTEGMLQSIHDKNQTEVTTEEPTAASLWDWLVD